MGIIKKIFEPIYILGLFLLAIIGSLFSLTFIVVVVTLVSIVFIPLLILNFIFTKTKLREVSTDEDNKSNNITPNTTNS